MIRPLALAFVLAIGACSVSDSEPSVTTTIVTVPTSATSVPDDGSTTSSTDPTTDTTTVAPTGEVVTVIVDPARAVALADTAAAFTVATGIDVDLVAVDSLAAVRARAAESDVDLFIGAHTWQADLLADGAIAGIGGFSLDSFSAAAASAFTIDGVVHGVPYAAEALVLYVNHGTYGEDLPTDLLTACAAEPCFVMPGLGEAGGYHLVPFLMADGGSDLLDVLDAGYASPDGLEAFVALAASPRHALTSIADARSRIATSAGLFVGGPWDLGPIEDSGIDFSVIPLPSVDGVELRPPVAVQGFYLSANAPNPEGAVQFLTGWLAHEDAQRDLWLRDRRAPVHGSLTDLGAVADAFATAVESGFLLPRTDLEPIWEELGAAAAAIYDGAVPASAIADAADRIRERIG